MQAPGDNSITVVESHVEPYADNNLNEKNLGTQYIYTTEGELIPASEEHNPSNMDLNSQHYNTVHVTEAQAIHIQPVDYQYEQQYSSDTVQQLVPVSGTEFVQDQPNTYIIDQPSYASQTPQENVPTEVQQEFTSEMVPEQPTSYENSETTQVEEPSATKQPVTSESHSTGESTSSEPSDIQQSKMEVVENPDLVDEVEEPAKVKEISDVPTSENVATEVPTIESEIKEVQENNEGVEMVEQNATGPEEIVAAIEEEESSLEILKSNPAIEIENEEESLDANEETVPVVQESQVVKEPQGEGMETNEHYVSDALELGEPEEVKEETTNGQVAVSTEEDKRADAEIPIETETTEGNAATEATPSPRPRGRRPKTDIPLHILGHDVNKPMENFVNGRTPKPRLGVKVPYRNLTSQIVSTAEIEKEILDRGRKKQEEKQEISFARQLTSRLAQKIAPQSDEKSKGKSSKTPRKKTQEDEDKDHEMDVDNNGNEETQKEKPKDAIDNNSDLLAILEGEDDTEEIPELAEETQDKESTPTDETNLKNLEREIALQQLHDLPYLTPKTKFVKGNKFKVYSKEPNVKPVENAAPQSEKTAPIAKQQTPKSPIKSNMLKLDVEPQIKVNMTLKTYSRKRKSTDGVVESSSSPTKKTNVEISTEEIDIKPNMQPPTSLPVYITKSSRIIKKKVIWDPDETPSRTKPSPVKTEANSQAKVTQKPVHPKNENKPADLLKKLAADSKAKAEKKVEEKLSTKKTITTEKRLSSGIPKQLAVKAKKPRSEVDRLLGDEGAIKMLYELKNSENIIEEKRKKTVISVEKTFKELAKKANQIKSDLVNTSGAETPKSLRKKEAVVSPISAPKPASPMAVSTPVIPCGISRQKSKDSARSTPPLSPAFSYPNEVSYLIRRRSSSSISSGDDTGGSLDLDDTEERLSKKKPISTSVDPLKIKKSKNASELGKLQKRAENRIGHYNTFTFKKANKSVTIDLHTGTSTEGYFTSELLGELTTVLNKLSKEKDCNVVLIRSSKDSVFSYGLNYKKIVFDKESTRKNKANELADRVRDFIQCLIDFPKILVVGIQGECQGLAVTMLPLFDIVIASDDAQFSTSYSSLGCVAEAGFLLTVPHVSSYGLAGELLYASQKLTADEACRRGLIAKLCWPEKYQETLKATITAVSQGSKQSLEATKKQLRSSIKQSIEEAMESMTTELVEHWTSNECQSNFANIE